jgi:adenosine kinase
MTLSDSFCVDRYRDEFLDLMRGGALDIVFANRAMCWRFIRRSDFGRGCRGHSGRRRRVRG